MDGEFAAKNIQDLVDLLRPINRKWLFTEAYSSGLLQQSDLMDESDLTPLCNAIEKDKRNLHILVKTIRNEAAYSYIADNLQNKYSKYK